MKCKNCGGELILQSGTWQCASCGATGTLDSVYENIDVFICYEENDNAGRRTRDSIVAQEVYRKLEDKKITTYYERISADGIIGDDLEASKLAAIDMAKCIVVIGTSAEAFEILEAKYGDHFSTKPVIPFCVDVNPGAIPKTLSKIQAMNYSTIGWDKDLIKGICNVLGREPELNTLTLFGSRKKKIILISAIAAAVVVAAVAVFVGIKFFSKPEKSKAPQQQETTEAADKSDKPLTNSEIYKKAMELLDKGKYLKAAKEFNKIIDYKDSSEQIKKIYDRYDGYYQDEEQTCSLYINIIDGKTVEYSFEKIVDTKVIKAEESLILENNNVSGKYIDNLQNEGSISISLTDEKIDLTISTEVENSEFNFGEITKQFDINNKSDRPLMKTITKEELLSWINTLTYIEDVKTSGYELEYMDVSGEGDRRYGIQYKLSNTDITIVTTDYDLTKYDGETEDIPQLDTNIVVAIIAPVDFMCPEIVDKRAYVFESEDVIFAPNTTMCYGYKTNLEFHTSITESNLSSIIVDKDSYVGFTSKKQVGDYIYNSILETNDKITDSLHKALVLEQYNKDNQDESYIRTEILEKNNDTVLVCVHNQNRKNVNSGYFHYYRLNIVSEECSFVAKYKQSYTVNKYGSAEYKYDIWKKYPEKFEEFLPDTWDQLTDDAMERIVKRNVREKYGLDEDEWISYQEIVNNDSHILIAVRTTAQHAESKCAWYKVDKVKTVVTFVKEGTYVEDDDRFSKVLWFKEYSDLAKEFPALYGDPSELELPYLSGNPFAIEITFGWAYSEATYNASEGHRLDNGTYTIIEVQYDKWYHPWGKLESGDGWVDLYDYFD